MSSILPAKALELYGLEQVKESTQQLLERVEGLADEAHTLAEGGEAVGKVLGVWEELFSVIRLMGTVTGQQASSSSPDEESTDADAEAAASQPTEKLKHPNTLQVTILFPPAAVAFISGCSCDLCVYCSTHHSSHPLHSIHAFWLIFKRMAAEEKYGYKGFNYLGNGKYESIQGITTEPHQPPPAYGATDSA
ncbi:hypothetical protein E3P99_02745 [Wallemia hederae]|uniref:Uncharacterized protein n=1 Tax=Wallemia hederae TaxID=1540922 RepID=A0A4T0FIC7_9BASI|nr:hypothetical protein E3P99_02745 [Wallemia hederae]